LPNRRASPRLSQVFVDLLAGADTGGRCDIFDPESRVAGTVSRPEPLPNSYKSSGSEIPYASRRTGIQSGGLFVGTNTGRASKEADSTPVGELQLEFVEDAPIRILTVAQLA